MSDTDVQVLNILGQPYSIRAPEHEQQMLQRASELLAQHVAESEQRYPKARSLELMVLTALNLCVPLSQHHEQQHDMQQRLGALLESISNELKDS